jgi:hypothetical protein
LFGIKVTVSKGLMIYAKVGPEGQALCHGPFYIGRGEDPARFIIVGNASPYIVQQGIHL